jgi:long-subunit acyl-CoA synthetase (AMP-forming)
MTGVALKMQAVEPQFPLQCLLHWAETRGNAVYMTQPLADGSVQEFTWSDVRDQALRAAAWLRSLGLPSRSNIILLGRNSAHWIIADLAIWMAGHVSVPLYPTLNAETAEYIIEHCNAQLCFVGRMGGIDDGWRQLKEVLPRDKPVVALPMAPDAEAFPYDKHWENLLAEFSPTREIDDRSPDDLATIVYTSGTTGKPKGVMHSFRSLSAPCRCTAGLWHPSESDRMLSYLPLAHIGERAAVEIPSLIFGFQVFFNSSLETFVQDLKRARPTRFFSVPRLWTKFYQGVSTKIPPERLRILLAIPFLSGRIKRKILQELGLDQVTVGLTGAAPLPAEIIRWYRQLGLELLEVFGMTENAATSHASSPGQVKPGYVGVPLAGVECRIDENGEVLIKSPGQMLGYYKMEEETRRCITEDGFFRTGDCGEVDAEQRLKITGRIKEIFKTSKGKYVVPVPIENRLGAYPKIEVPCVTGPGMPQPFALLMLSEGAAGSTSREQLEGELHGLLEHVNSTLEDHEKLDFLVAVRDPWTIEGGFLTPTMKLKRSKIEERYMPMAEKWRAMNRKIIWE